jgi:hypothetical protein
MKTSSTFQLAVIICGLLLSFPLWAQSDYRPGYIITLNGDTIHGKIDYRDADDMGRRCLFEAADGTKTVYAPADIAGYRFPNSKYYVSRTLNGLKYFLEYLIQGRLDVYYLRTGGADHYYIEKEDQSLTEVPPMQAIEVVNEGKLFLQPASQSIGFLNYYTQDAPALKGEISRMNTLDHQGMIRLAKDYHQIVCDDGEQCIIFERPVRVKWQVTATGGYFWLPGHNTAFYGLGLAVQCTPQYNENFYLKTGFFLLRHKAGESTFRWPLQFEYRYPKGLIRPSAAVGLAFYGTILRPIASGGLNLVLPKSPLGISLSYDLETPTIVSIYDGEKFWKRFSHSASLGISYTF